MKYFEAKIKSKKYLIEGILDVQLKVKKDYTFIPGEFSYIKVEGELTRPYSIVSSIEGIVTFLIDCRNPGKGSDFFRKSEIDDLVYISEPVGKFRCNTDSTKQKIFIATGTGLAPFIPMIKELRNQNLELIFGYREEGFENLVDHYLPIKNLKVTFCQSSPTLTVDRFEGRVTRYLETKGIQFFADKEFYICGRNDVVKDVMSLLKSKNVQNIFFENYG